MTTLSLADWLNFSVASIEAEKMFIGFGPRVQRSNIQLDLTPVMAYYSFS